MTAPSAQDSKQAFDLALQRLLSLRSPQGHWEGELSTSALSTAVAVSALHRLGLADDSPVENGIRWLVQNQNQDGGYGDTTRSHSNISTTLLVLASFHITGRDQRERSTVERIKGWLGKRYGTTPAEWAESVRRRYGKDRTFSVPILTTLALAGLIPWTEVPPLPFELAALPQSWYRFVRLPVVSYALPALIAIGLCIHQNRPTWNPWARFSRWITRARVLSVLETIQPSNGGFLEATPLTAFVTLSLIGAGEKNHPVVKKAHAFLLASVRPDGSWSIDTHLATWVTSLAIQALSRANGLDQLDGQAELRDWYLKQQYRQRHPYTGAPPGGWAWTPLPGGVPDADDTPGAILALKALGQPDGQWRRLAMDWLTGLQNGDGGIPTFCKGWGALPFDRSGTDLTAHTLRALAPWKDTEPRVSRLTRLGLDYLRRTQRSDGSWLPLWFGHQDDPEETNPVFGTARVLAAYRDLNLTETSECQKGVAFLVGCQNPDGGWGGNRGIASQVEETALVLDALVDLKAPMPTLEKGHNWLIRQVLTGRLEESAPIGFYFAKLWYYESLYPVIFAVSALGRFLPRSHRENRNPS